MVVFDNISDAIAEQTYRCRRAEGEEFRSRVVIGRPQHTAGAEEGEWCCPIFIDAFTNRIVPAGGAAPVEALENALRLVASFRETCSSAEPEV